MKEYDRVELIKFIEEFWLTVCCQIVYKIRFFAKYMKNLLIKYELNNIIKISLNE